MKTTPIYAILFPPLVWLFLNLLNVADPLRGGLRDALGQIWLAYAVEALPALLTVLALHWLRHRGYRTIFSIFVAGVTVPLMHAALFVPTLWWIYASSLAGILSAICCWGVARLIPKRR